jgi:hypothetical protein
MRLHGAIGAWAARPPGGGSRRLRSHARRGRPDDGLHPHKATRRRRHHQWGRPWHEHPTSPGRMLWTCCFGLLSAVEGHRLYHIALTLGCGSARSYRAITEPLHHWHAALRAAARASGWLSPFPCAAAQGSGATQGDMANLYVIALLQAFRGQRGAPRPPPPPRTAGRG